MVIYSNLNGNRELVERFANFQKYCIDMQKSLPFFLVELKSAIQVCCRGQWYKYECYEDPILAIEKSVHGALFLAIKFNDIDLSTGELMNEDNYNYYPFELIEQIVIE